MITFRDFLDDYYNYKSREEVHLPDFMKRSGMELLPKADLDDYDKITAFALFYELTRSFNSQTPLDKAVKICNSCYLATNFKDADGVIDFLQHKGLYNKLCKEALDKNVGSSIQDPDISYLENLSSKDLLIFLTEAKVLVYDWLDRGTLFYHPDYYKIGV